MLCDWLGDYKARPIRFLKLLLVRIVTFFQLCWWFAEYEVLCVHHVLHHISTLVMLILFGFSYLLNQVWARVNRGAERALSQFLADPLLQVAGLVGASIRILILWAGRWSLDVCRWSCLELVQLVIAKNFLMTIVILVTFDKLFGAVRHVVVQIGQAGQVVETG